MSDHRDDDAAAEPPEGSPPPPDETADESLEIREMTPPPPGDDDATTALPTAPSDEPAPPEPPVAPPPEAASPPPEAAAPPPPVGAPPPAVDDPAAGDDPATDDARPWPASAKTAVAILAVLAVAGIIGTVVGFVRAASAEDDADVTTAELTAERERAEAAEAEAEELGEALIATTEERDELAEQRAELLTERDDALAELEEQQAISEAEQARLEAEIEELESQLAAIEELLGDLDDLFPLEIGLDLGQVGIAGSYAVSLTEIGCSGFDELCGATPNVGPVTIGPDLRLTSDVLDVPFTVVDGTPFGAADNEDIVPPCNDVPRATSLTMALFDDGVEIGADGDVTVTALGATIVIDAPETDGCPIGRVWYRAQLTPN